MTSMLKDEKTRKKFVDHSVGYLQKFDFDGLDLDFECL
jgi:GH18 family chitinase